MGLKDRGTVAGAGGRRAARRRRLAAHRTKRVARARTCFRSSQQVESTPPSDAVAPSRSAPRPSCVVRTIASSPRSVLRTAWMNTTNDWIELILKNLETYMAFFSFLQSIYIC